MLAGEEVGVDELVTLLAARGPDFLEVAAVADQLRIDTVGDAVTFVRNRNINYTNVCTFKCKFCAFSKGPLSLNLRGNPYLLDHEEIQRRVLEAVDCGATEVCLQGGIHPDFDGEYYLVGDPSAVKEVARRSTCTASLRSRSPKGRAASACRWATTSCRPRRRASPRCPAPRPRSSTTRYGRSSAPTRSTPTSGSTPTAPRTRSGCARTSPSCSGTSSGPSTCTRHLVRTRSLQQETGGFTEFVPLPFVHMATPIFLQHKARKGPTIREVLLMHTVGRIAYRGWIDNVQVSWVKTGVTGARQALQAGCNDLGGTLIDENISRGGRQSRPGARRVRAARHRRPARATARAAHHALRPHPHRRSTAAAAAGGGGSRPDRVVG